MILTEWMEALLLPKVNELQKLLKYITKNGFEHHVAMVRGNVSDILSESVETYLKWNIYKHS